MTTPALRVLAALRAGAHPVVRPRSAVVHLHRGPMTPSGRLIPRAGRTVCRARTGRLHVLEVTPGGAVELGGRRFCRRCTTALPPALGSDVKQLITRDDWATAYGHLVVDDLALAASWSRTVAETYTVATVASIVLGGMPHTQAVDRVVLARRRVLAAAERTPEEIAAVQRDRETQQHNDALIAAGRRRDAAINRAVERRSRGGYLMPHERDLLDTA